MTTVYSEADVSKHNTKKDLWVIIHGKVYDLTHYLEDHPGGVDSLCEVAGRNGTTVFEDLGHSADARDVMQRFLVGRLDHEEDDAPEKVARNIPPEKETPPQSLIGSPLGHALTEMVSMSLMVVLGFGFMRRFSNFSTSHHWPIPYLVTNLLPWATSISLASILTTRFIKHSFSTPKQDKKPAHFKVVNLVAHAKAENYAILDPRHHIDLPITSIEKLSSNTNKITLDLPSATSVLGLPVGQHIAIRGVVDDNPVNRSYTPTSSNKDLGRLELVIKNYDDGLLTGNYLKHVSVGDRLSISGPRGQMRYRRGLAKTIGMIAGGTGITPMFQIIRAICEDPRDDTKIVLIYANQTAQDILLKAELDRFAEQHAVQFEVKYLLSKPGADWKGGVGRCTQELVETSFAGPQDKDNKVMLCGPQGMVDSAKGWLEDLGYEPTKAVSKMQDQVFVF